MTFVSVLCCTYNRQHLIPYIIHQYDLQTYPKDKRELIIYDDSDYPCYFESSDRSVKYKYDNFKRTIGYKRNYLNTQAKGDIIVWQDDDDYYFPDRIEKTVEAILQHDVNLIGVKTTTMYDAVSRRCVLITHPMQNYTQNNIMAYRKEYLQENSYHDSDQKNEEKFFTCNFTNPLYAFEGNELCIHIAHTSNTVQKKRFFEKMQALKYDIRHIIKDEFALDVIEYLGAKRDAQLTFNWINLKKDHSRGEFMERQFDSLGLRNIRFEALTPSDVEYKARRDILNKTRPEEFACMCSHLKLLRDQVTSDDKQQIVVLEDDLHLTPEVVNLQSIIANAPIDWEILQIHHVCFDPKQQHSRRPWVRWDRHKYCTTFYVMKRSAAERLVSKYVKESKEGLIFDFTSCTEVVQADKYIFRQSKTYTLMRPIARTNLSFETNIQANWAIKKRLIEKAEHRADQFKSMK